MLCADDYGMNEGVSEGILALADAGRISATSCMTNAPDWPHAARDLVTVEGRIGIGLHLTLSWGRPLGTMPRFAPDGAMPALGTVMRLALSGRLPQDEIAAEIERQLDRFCEERGREPDFVDGHQHVQILPGIRRLLLAALARRGWAGRVWLRDSSDRLASIMARRIAGPKALLVHGLALGFRREAARSGFETNDGFSGYSPFDPARPNGPDMERHLSALGPEPLVMCHPGRTSGDDGDEIAAARVAEFVYLSSPAFAELLDRRGLRLVPRPSV
ncbi:ChbG/HpnK family deacetylase [Enterovirga rhinocerotis]|uniref:ChbG/HpnK family deacetylase n=1 Tax=Enterovirga rhinocerotis TaxID=1339210 RepID=UPI001FDED715|nr:ChbG/HpnK family deacetylase [Enterovirga rhinocerotis]